MTTENDNIVLHVADVHKTFGGLHALSDIDLQIEEGKTHAIIGLTALANQHFSMWWWVVCPNPRCSCV